MSIEIWSLRALKTNRLHSERPHLEGVIHAIEQRLLNGEEDRMALEHYVTPVDCVCFTPNFECDLPLTIDRLR